jgi:corrinoid protein of di/trimethylamine methyltransferase
MPSKEQLLKELSDAVVDMDEEKTVDVSHAALQNGIDAYEAIDKGLADGMDRAGQLFEQEEYFVPELLICSDAMYAGLEVLKPHLKASEDGEKHKFVIGVIEGDTHDIGKNLVKIMVETSGFEIIDLGRDVPPQQFVDKALEVGAAVIGISTLMTTTMDGIKEVIRLLNAAQVRERFKVMVGGGPISQSFADRIGADGYAINAAEAVRVARQLVENGSRVPA